MTDEFGHWLAGFIDGEGCFAIGAGHGPRSGYRPVFKLCVRADDQAIIREIHETTGIGTFRVSAHSGGSPQARWYVTNKDACMALVDLLDRYPLRAKKARDFAIWREAVIEWHRSMYQGQKGRNAADWSKLGELRTRLMTQRTYEWYEAQAA